MIVLDCDPRSNVSLYNRTHTTTSSATYRRQPPAIPPRRQTPAPAPVSHPAGSHRLAVWTAPPEERLAFYELSDVLRTVDLTGSPADLINLRAKIGRIRNPTLRNALDDVIRRRVAGFEQRHSRPGTTTVTVIDPYAAADDSHNGLLHRTYGTDVR
jgi:hypothetical protein